MLADFDVCVYNGSIYNGVSRVYEDCDFIYIGYVGFDNKRQNIILTNIDANPVVRIVTRTEIARHIMSGSIRSVSVHHLLQLMKRVDKVPSLAQYAWGNAYDVHLQQWVEGVYFEKNCEKIKQAWLNAFYNPSFLVCKKRLYREFEEMRR